MDNAMRISVVISSHDRPEGVRALLSDLVAQELSTDASMEIVVVDSAGVDCARGACAEFASERVPVRHVSGPNKLAAKRNAGAAVAQGGILVFLDDDMRIGPRFIGAHLEAQQHRPGVLSSDIQFPESWVLSSNYYRYKNRHHVNGVSNEHRVPLAGNRFVAMAFSMRSAHFNQVGGFDEDFQRYGGEDIEFGYRALRAGFLNEHLPTAVAVHEEVDMDIDVYARKVYRASYHGMPMVVAKAPEARSVRIIKLTDPTVDRGPVARIVRVGSRTANLLRAEKAVRWVLRSTDSHRHLYFPVLYDLVVLMATQAAVDDRRAGRRDRSASAQSDGF